MVNSSSQDAPQPAAASAGDADADNSYTGSPFVTQTSVVESLNKALADLQSPDDTSNAPPHFELQKRLPNGNTRRATTEELQAADMESKLQQAAAQVEYLKTWDEKKQWAEEQRQYGNQLYRQERYELAIDVYLTCLVVAQQEKKLAPTEIDTDNGTQSQSQSAGLLFLYVMNNLAQSSLALKWFRKTEQFCTLALQEVYVNADAEADADVKHGSGDETKGDSAIRSTNIDATSLKFPKQQHQIAKLYYKRGKARRLGGLYKDARIDLETALQWIEWLANNKTKNDSTLEHQDKEQDLQAIADSRKVVERELQLVAKASAEARRNKERQQQAMQKVLSSSNKKDTNDSSETSAAQSATPQPSLFPEIKGKRTFSTLRAPSARRNEQDMVYDSEESLGVDEPQQLTYSQWYLVMIGRVAQKLLEWTGDEEYAKRSKED